MKKLSYLKYALTLGLHAKRAWVISAFAMTKEAKGTAFEGKLIPQPWGYSYLDSTLQEVKIEDAEPNKPLFTFKDQITIDASWAANVSEPTNTSVGNVLFNACCILSSFGAKFPFTTGSVSVSKLETIIAAKLQDTPESEAKRSNTEYYVDEYIKFVDSLQYITTFAQIATISATPKNIVAPTGIKAFKKQLIEKYGDTLKDPVNLAKFEAELLAFDNEFLKDDPSNGIFTAGKIKHTARKKMFLAMGAELQFSPSQTVTPVTNSLEEGWPTDPVNFAASMNGSRVGSFSRGAETVKGGVSAKYLLRSANNFKIVDQDCGTTLGIRRSYNEDNKSQLAGRYLILGNKVQLVENIDQASHYLNQPLVVRSPMYCKSEGDNICKVCAGTSLAQYPTGLTIPLTEISGIILATSLKAMHQNTTATAKLDLAQSLS